MTPCNRVIASSRFEGNRLNIQVSRLIYSRICRFFNMKVTKDHSKGREPMTRWCVTSQEDGICRQTDIQSYRRDVADPCLQTAILTLYCFTLYTEHCVCVCVLKVEPRSGRASCPDSPLPKVFKKWTPPSLTGYFLCSLQGHFGTISL